MTTLLTVEDRVARGAALLDEKVPGWVDLIDLDTLDLGSPCRCILGQTFADHPDADLTPFTFGVDSIFKVGADADDIAAYGFEVYLDDLADYYWSLTDEWTRVILARRAGGAA